MRAELENAVRQATQGHFSRHAFRRPCHPQGSLLVAFASRCPPRAASGQVKDGAGRVTLLSATRRLRPPPASPGRLRPISSLLIKPCRHHALWIDDVSASILTKNIADSEVLNEVSQIVLWIDDVSLKTTRSVTTSNIPGCNQVARGGLHPVNMPVAPSGPENRHSHSQRDP